MCVTKNLEIIFQLPIGMVKTSLVLFLQVVLIQIFPLEIHNARAMAVLVRDRLRLCELVRSRGKNLSNLFARFIATRSFIVTEISIFASLLGRTLIFDLSANFAAYRVSVKLRDRTGINKKRAVRAISLKSLLTDGFFPVNRMLIISFDCSSFFANAKRRSTCQADYSFDEFSQSVVFS